MAPGSVGFLPQIITGLHDAGDAVLASVAFGAVTVVLELAFPKWSWVSC